MEEQVNKIEQNIAKGLPPAAGMGRPKGAPNKSTAIVREAISNLLERNSEQMDGWLQKVAEGDPVHGIKPAPDKALDIMQKLCEYHIPKLARTEHTGKDEGPIQIAVGWQK